MKRSNQLIVESLIITSIMLGVLFTGTVSTSTLPKVWLNIQNPDSLEPVYNLTSIALFYYDVLTSLSSYEFQSASASLNGFQFLQIPPSLGPATQSANAELASMNETLPHAQYYLNETQSFYASGEFANASRALTSFCSNAEDANTSLSNFSGPDTSGLGDEGVPVGLYNPPVLTLKSEIASYLRSCEKYSSELSSGGMRTRLEIASFQTQLPPYGELWVYTGGELNLTATLEQNGSAVAGQVITFHVEGRGTSPSNLTSSTSGSVTGELTIPYLYTAYVDVWATVGANSSSGTPYVTSNVLNLTLLYNPTQIIIQDPPGVLPTFPFNVSGILRNNSTGSVLPNAPVKITSFNSSYFTTTNNLGVFTDRLVVPANATDGLHYIYAAFVPQGEYGPSTNFTSIVVYRLPINLTVTSPGLVFPGFSSGLSGSVEANGSALANSEIELSTPWGVFNVTSNSGGSFNVPFSVPLDEFAFSRQTTIRAMGAEPYLLGASATITISLLNIILVAILVIAAGFGFFEARNLGLRSPNLRWRRQQNLKEKETRAYALQNSAAILSEVKSQKSKIVSSYLESLSLAEKKFGVRILESMTIRETVALVSPKDGGYSFFSSIASVTEDYLYSFRADRRIEDAEQSIENSLSRLREIWFP